MSPGTSSEAATRPGGARTDDHRLGDHGIGEGFERPGRLGLLDVANDGVDQDHPDDDSRIHHFPEGSGDYSGRDEDVDQGLVELEQKAFEFGFAPARGQGVGAEFVRPPLDLQGVQALVRLDLEYLQHFLCRQVVPDFSAKAIHMNAPRVGDGEGAMQPCRFGKNKCLLSRAHNGKLQEVKGNGVSCGCSGRFTQRLSCREHRQSVVWTIRGGIIHGLLESAVAARSAAV